MQKPVSEMSFEEAIKELEEIVRKMESGEMPLDDSLTAYTRGTELAQFCRGKLQMAEKTIERLGEAPSESKEPNEESPF